MSEQLNSSNSKESVISVQTGHLWICQVFSGTSPDDLRSFLGNTFQKSFFV